MQIGVFHPLLRRNKRIYIYIWTTTTRRFLAVPLLLPETHDPSISFSLSLLTSYPDVLHLYTIEQCVAPSPCQNGYIIAENISDVADGRRRRHLVSYSYENLPRDRTGKPNSKSRLIRAAIVQGVMVISLFLAFSITSKRTKKRKT